MTRRVTFEEATALCARVIAGRPDANIHRAREALAEIGWTFAELTAEARDRLRMRIGLPAAN